TVLRKEKNITQTELAEYLFLTPQTVSRWEVGNGTPEITLLPKIATFFGISIDELFGMTSIKRAEDLVSKYSVLRDERSFQEAMECVNSQIQTIDISLKNDTENIAELEEQRDRLEALKTHLWIQQGWEGLQRALEIADSFVAKTEGNPEHPWYLRMRLQKNQLCAALAKGREALAECKRNFKENPNDITLQIYLSLLSNLQNYEEILSIQETESTAREIIYPPSEKNLGIWWLLIHAAVETVETDFIEKYMPPILEICNEEDEFDFLMVLLDFYKEESQKEKIKKRLNSLLPQLSLNQYFEEKAKERIEQS
ncbi:MAG: helix-turn-helix transcriptional regulator, partial [Lachnospiraceae bacterium]|nr:helix-turn-helix transcriptional regulator [Lachnospiraceae bacterium]